ncbi:MAG TPA: ABC transporter permease, partial [Spirochaetales bacterium]|nr:ABC transporter permease [Spirochaetales bacterium]
MRWTSFVSSRWYRRGPESGLSMVPAAAGIAVGVAALIVVIGVMNGFQMGFIDTVLELDSHHVRVSANTDPSALADSLMALPGVRSALPFADVRTLATGPYGRSEALKLKLIPEDAAQRDPMLVT